MRILDRYVLKNFFLPFAYSVLGLLAIWLIFDLSDNAADFVKGKVSFGKIVLFYLGQLPDIAILCLPAGILLALLYSLSKMSRANEIISMLTAGVGLHRILAPLFIFGFLTSLFVTFLNYQLVPRAQAVKDVQLAQFVSGVEDDPMRLVGHLFYNRSANRFWYAERFYPNENRLDGVQIMQRDADGDVAFQYYVRRATYLPYERSWDFDKGMLVKYDKSGNVTSSEYLSGETRIYDWEETPWRIASATMNAEVLTVPQLREYLFHNSDFTDVQLAPYRTHLWYRWSLPWVSFVVVFLAAPLGVVFSRRGVLAGVASSIFVFAAILFLKDLFLALGAGCRIPAPIAAWTPNLVFLAIGLWLLWMRVGNRDATHVLPQWATNLLKPRWRKPGSAPTAGSTAAT